MKYLSLWVLVLTLAVSGCSAEEPTETASAVDNGALTKSQSEIQATKPAAKPIKVAQNTAKPTQTAAFKQGSDYRLLTPVQPTSSSPDQIEVTEAFMYGCPHCFSFEPFLQKWTPDKPQNVNFVRMPVAFNRQAEVHARVYYTADALGIIEQTHLPFFREIHVNRRQMTSEKDLVEFFSDYGIDESTFLKAFRSFDVEHKLRVARTMSERYRIDSVPTVVINGKYTSGGSNLAGDKLLGLIDYLVAKEDTSE